MMDGTAARPGLAFTLNGRPVAVDPPPGERLSQTLRERLGAREVKIGCNAGDCGACTVLVAGAPVCACLMPAHQAEGQAVETVAGLRGDPLAQRLSESFQDHQAAQCGICTPGMMVAAVALLREIPRPDAAQVQDALGGVLCRCTGYRKIIDAVVAVGAGWTPPEGTGAVGTAVRRVDGAAKVAGTERFGDDIAPPDALVIKVIRSPHPRAAFTLGDLAGWARDRPGIVCTLTARDVPGRNAFGVIPAFVDQPVFAEGETRFRGEAVAAVVGTAEAMAAFDPQDFPVRWQPLTEVRDVAEALADEAPQLHPGKDRNVMCGGFVSCGDASSALARADVVVEGRFESGFVEHAYIEPEAGYAVVRDGRVEIHACTQAPVMDLESMAEILALPRESIRIVPTAVGGGFGSKLDLSVQPYLALAALKTGRAVRITYSRTESMQSTTKRHPSDLRLRIGATRDGRLCGMTFEGDFNTGAYASWGPTVATRVPIHASGPYRIADYTARSRGVYTHNPPSGAFRGFGVPQSAIAQESLFDALAAKLGMDPLEFRIANALDERRAHGLRSGVPARRGHPRLSGGAAPGLGRGTGGLCGVQCAGQRASARGGRGGGVVWLRQHLARQSLDHRLRYPRGWHAGAASGRDGYRAGVEHRHRADLRTGPWRAVGAGDAGRAGYRCDAGRGQDLGLAPDLRVGQRGAAGGGGAAGGDPAAVQPVGRGGAAAV